MKQAPSSSMVCNRLDKDRIPGKLCFTEETLTNVFIKKGLIKSCFIPINIS